MFGLNGAYVLSDGEGEYSPDPGDYWDLPETYVFEGMALVKRRHHYRTVTGRTVTDSRLLKTDPTMRDLRRLEHAYNAR